MHDETRKTAVRQNIPNRFTFSRYRKYCLPNLFISCSSSNTALKYNRTVRATANTPRDILLVNIANPKDPRINPVYNGWRMYLNMPSVVSSAFFLGCGSGVRLSPNDPTPAQIIARAKFMAPNPRMRASGSKSTIGATTRRPKATCPTTNSSPRFPKSSVSDSSFESSDTSIFKDDSLTPSRRSPRNSLPFSMRSLVDDRRRR
mmetsp:Transcript_11250/g.21574  ORF Transcript_11250/g.21574 Transcript_11250/m.21574 type:complete len:203 (-) Transcript_11250:175-783(-)